MTSQSSAKKWQLRSSNYNLWNIISMFIKQISFDIRDSLVERIRKKPFRPLVKHREIAIIEKLLTIMRPKRCLEWGVGFSTLAFPQLLPRSSIWVGIEHSEGWAKKIRELNPNPNVKIYHIAPEKYPWSDINKDGAYADLVNYIDFPSKLGNFDFIFIDGRARNAALLKAYKLLKRKGVVVLHDANRRYYDESMKKFKHQVLFTDYRKGYGGLWLGSKGINLEQLLKIKDIKLLWSIYKLIGLPKIGKFIKL